MFSAGFRSAFAVPSVGRPLLPLCAACAIAALTAPALAHDAKPTAAKPQGWSYPFACCANYDCREVSQTSISERPEGYVIKDTGEVLAYSDRRIKDSPDGEFHWCAHVAGLDAGKTICLFVPPQSY
ncbi:hypothetical protein FKO01_31280 [Mesorhizobium sp. B2-3-3]|uniref:hypothetical protein n=1 Tax=unclassified Mesorhizobium TaxID=325217 RepID=UPI00112D7058|nr:MULTISPECIES: hypothetical protein [unclassified Mesorhizobium]TPN21560.1 hypothetical protein FKO01_31280 [Mesorhizobium sp. B2-3-3]TPK63838.1 hypothetical protein FJ930_26000 [Mesorhizobium sp. B2-4-15]TPK82617.1 hypothetical protein FJ548_20120 [Mesorhizobium sp. B2-4-17]TPK95528.1 hypothetical protein FJ934_11410 [Mesorhizobium sp. B2-4-12]TPK97170.1 hypothetical protein FJ938_26665 [Mesorhizobium sp. B2-4-14]